MTRQIVQKTLDAAENTLELYGDKHISADVLLIDLRKKSRDLVAFDVEAADALERFANAVEAAKAHADAWMRIVDVRKRYREWRRMLRRQELGVSSTEELVAKAMQRSTTEPLSSERKALHADMLAAAERARAEAEARVMAHVEEAKAASRAATDAARAELGRMQDKSREAEDLVRSAEEAVKARTAGMTAAAEDAVKARGADLTSRSAPAQTEAAEPVDETDYASAIAEIESLLKGALDDAPAEKDKKL